MQKDFYTSSLITELHLVSQGNLSLTFHYIKSFTKFLQDYTFEKPKHNTKTLESHKNLIWHNKTPICKSEITPDKTQIPKKEQTLVVALPSQPKAFFKVPTLSQ